MKMKYRYGFRPKYHTFFIKLQVYISYILVYANIAHLKKPYQPYGCNLKESIEKEITL